MVVSFSAEQPTIYKYDKSKVTSQCDKETDIIGLEEWRVSLKNKKSGDNNEQLDDDDTNERSSPVITKKNKKWMYSDEDENTSNTSPITGKRNTSPISSKFSSSTNTKTNNSTLPIRGSKKEQTIKSKKKKKKRNMLDSDSSSEEEAFIDKESFGILKLKKRVRIDQEKRKRTEQSKVKQHHETEQQTVDVGELKGNVSNAASSNDGIDHHETATLVDKEKSQSAVQVLNDSTLNDGLDHEAASLLVVEDVSQLAAVTSLSEVDKSTSVSSPAVHNDNDTSLALVGYANKSAVAITLSVADKSSASVSSVQVDASTLVGEEEHKNESAAARDSTSRCSREDNKEPRGIKESAVTADQPAIKIKEPSVPPEKEDDDMEVGVIEEQRVKILKDGGVDRKCSFNDTKQEKVENGADVTSGEDISRSSINTRLNDDEKNKKISHSGGSDSPALFIDLTSSGDEDESPTTQVWICGACTLENTNPLALACEVCAVSRKESEKWKSAQWSCPTCTLLNDNSTSVCDACNYNRDSNKSSAPSKQPKKKRRSAGDSERERQLAMWEEDRSLKSMKNKKRARHSFPGAAVTSASSSNYNAIDLQGLAAARHERQSMKFKPHHTAGGGDSTWMPGEFGLSGSVRYWDLTHTTSSSRHAQAKAGLCGAGHRHLDIIMKTLNKRTSSVTLKRAQYLVNPTLCRKFEALKARLSGSHKVVYLFHGTGEKNIDSIASKGFLTRHAASGPGLIWFSRQSTYSYGFTVSVPGKGLSSSSSASSSSSWGARGMSGMMMPDPGSIIAPSGRMFICALLVARGQSETSNVGDKGQDVITMTKEAACLPCYLIDTTMDSTSYPGGLALPGFGQTSRSFQGKGNTLGGRKLG